MKYIFLVLVISVSLFGGVLKSKIITVDEDATKATIKIKNIDIGVNGFVVHTIEGQHTMILKNAVVTEFDKNTHINEEGRQVTFSAEGKGILEKITHYLILEKCVEDFLNSEITTRNEGRKKIQQESLDERKEKLSQLLNNIEESSVDEILQELRKN